MKYRKMGSLDWEVSALGFGAMRLPTKEIVDEETNEKKVKIDEDKAIHILRYAIDNGVNYIDTAWPYHGGESEIVVGKALKDGYREKVKLVTKLPVWLIKKEEDFDFFLNKQLEKLQTDHLDLYLFHSLKTRLFETVKKFNLIKKMEDAKEKGLIKHIGFSFHDSYEVFKEIIDYYDWDAAQIQHNYLDIDYQATTKGLKYAASKDIAVIIMEPLRGGKLTMPFPEVNEIIKKASKNRTLAFRAFQFLWNQPEVSVVLSGMGAKWMVSQNMYSADQSGINTLSEEDLEIISELREEYKKHIFLPCTNCEYCQPCPSSVNIPLNFTLLNEIAWWGERARPNIMRWYDNMAKSPEEVEESKGEKLGNASLCIQCEECLEKCPQGIDIPHILEKELEKWLPCPVHCKQKRHRPCLLRSRGRQRAPCRYPLRVLLW